MSAQLSYDDLSQPSKGQSFFDLAAAMDMKTLPLSSYHLLAELDPYTGGVLPAYSHHGSHYTHEQSHNALLSLPSTFPGSSFVLHDALADAFVSSSLAQRPVSPHHFSMRWPVADSYRPYPVSAAVMNSQTLPLFQPSAPTSVQAPPQNLGSDPLRSAAQPAWSVSGSLDPATGVFQQMSEHPRLRTAQACEKCRIRKAKCSGEQPSCQRCRSRGLLCEYAPERRMRGPNKNKRKNGIMSDQRSSTPLTDRRTSIASTSSNTSELDPSYRFPEVPHVSSPISIGHAYGSHSPSPVEQSLHPHSYPRDAPSPLRFSFSHSDPIDPLSPVRPPRETLHSIAAGRRPRPPPLNLGNAAFPGVHHYVRDSHSQEPIPSNETSLVDDITPTHAARRTSLPVNLLEAAAYHQIHDPSAAFDTLYPGSMLDSVALSPFYAHSRSNSTSDGSMQAPTTPMSLPDSVSGADIELAYPDDTYFERVDGQHRYIDEEGELMAMGNVKVPDQSLHAGLEPSDETTRVSQVKNEVSGVGTERTAVGED